MNPVEQLNLTIWSWIETVRSMRRGIYFVPFLLYLAAQGVLFVLLWVFAHPAVSWFMAPLLVRGFGEPATHYPNNFLVFPTFFARADLPMAILLGGLLFGAATYLFAAGFCSRSPHLGEAFARARGNYLKLALSQVPGTALAALILFLAERQIAMAPDMAGTTIRLFRYGGLFLAIVVQALFAFAMVLIVFERAGLFRSFRDSMRLAGRNTIGTFLLVAFPILLHYPAVLIFRRSILLVERGAPEMIAAVTAGDVLVGLIANYFVMAAVTRFYLAGRRAG